MKPSPFGRRQRIATVAWEELRRQWRSPLLWGLLFFAGFATLTVNPAAMIPSGDAAVGGVTPFANSRYALAQVFALTGLLFYTFLASILAGLAVPHDDDAQVGELLHSTPLTPGEYLSGKLTGILAALLSVLALHLLFAIGWYEGGSLLGSDASIGPFRLASYLEPLAFFLAPGLFFCAALGFAAGTITRSPMAVFALPTATFLVTLGGLIPRPTSAADRALDLIFDIFDLWGARWLSETVFTADRGVEFYNTMPFSFDGAFLVSRCLALGLPGLALFLAWRHFQRQVRGETFGRSRTADERSAATEPATGVAPAVARPPAARRPLAELSMTAKPPGLLTATWQVARIELAQVRSQPGLYLFAAFAMLLAWEYAGSARGVFDSVPIHTAGGLAVGQLEATTTLICLLLLFHLVEALDRMRRLGIGALVFSTPLPTTALLAGAQLAGMVLAIAVFGVSAAVGLLVLLLQPAGKVELLPFLQIYLLLAPTCLFWSSLVAAIYSFSRDRFVTYLAAMVILVGMASLLLQGSLTWLTNWLLWDAVRWSDIGAFELDGEPLLLNRFLFLAAALFCQWVAFAAFPRIERESLRWLRPFSIQLTALATLVLVPALALAIGIRQGPEGQPAQDRAKEYWRRNVSTWAAAEPPTLVEVDARVVIEPDRHEMRVAGSYTVENAGSAPIDRLPFTLGDGFGEVVWRLDGRTVLAEDRSGLHLLTPAAPLAPNARMVIGFSYRNVLPRGYSRNGGGASEFILPSGVLLTTLGSDFLPLPGFLADRGVSFENRAEKAADPPGLWRLELPPINGNRRPFTSRIEVDLPAGYRSSATGERVEQREHEGRLREIWRSDHPVRFLSLAAGRWQEKSDVSEQGKTAVLYHHAHPYNADEMLSTLVAARRFYSEFFYPYPWRELRLTEYADHATRAQGFPTHIPFSEGIGFLTRSDRDVEGGGASLPALVTAHEAAHQWWAHLLTPGRGPGADVLIEGMANYSTLLLLEAEHGLAARIHFARQLEASYAEKRRVDGEKPLLRSSGGERPSEETVVYDKGAWVVWMMHNHLGREKMSAGLHDFIGRFASGPDHPLLEDLIETLRPLAASPERYQAFVDQWFGRVELPELVFREARILRQPGGWRVEGSAENIGSGTAEVEVAVQRGMRFYAAGEKAVAYREARIAVSLAAGERRDFAIETDFEPERLSFDPDALLLQANRDLAVRDLASAERMGDSR